MSTVAFSGMTISNGSVSNGAGAGISNSVGTVNVVNCALSDNSASNNGTGGGIFNSIGTVNVVNCTLTGNSAVNGGGIFNSGGTVTIINNSLSDNMAVDGGGIYSSSGTATITSSTLSGNTASSTGGGVHSDAGGVNVVSSTISNNGAGQGGGIDNTDAVINAKSTIIAKNVATTAPDLSGAATSQGYNLIGNNSGALITPTTGDQIGTAGSPIDPILDPAGLQNNGGPTKTVALMSNSPAINSGDPNAPARDQRYYLRNGASDKGAFEHGGTISPLNAVSRKMHGAVGTFDVDLPLSGNAGIECRSGGAGGDHQIVATFATLIAAVANTSVSSGTGSVDSSSINGSQVIVNLTGVSNAQQIVVLLSGVSDGANSNNVNIPMRLLLGDTTANATVNSSDVGQTKAQLGQSVTNSNFKTDVNVNGTINASDIAIVKSQVGTSVP